MNRDDGLFDVDAVTPARPTGRVEAATLSAVRAASLDARDAAAAALAVELARAVDVAALGRAPAYPVATAARELRDVLTRLRLDPASRAASVADPVADLVAALNVPA